MASAAEQLAANFNIGAFSKAAELKKRIWFTLGALVVYRLGTYIPLPGIDAQILQDVGVETTTFHHAKDDGTADIDALLDAIGKARETDAVLLHGCF